MAFPVTLPGTPSRYKLAQMETQTLSPSLSLHPLSLSSSFSFRVTGRRASFLLRCPLFSTRILLQHSLTALTAFSTLLLTSNHDSHHRFRSSRCSLCFKHSCLPSGSPSPGMHFSIQRLSLPFLTVSNRLSRPVNPFHLNRSRHTLNAKTSTLSLPRQLQKLQTVS